MATLNGNLTANIGPIEAQADFSIQAGDVSNISSFENVTEFDSVGVIFPVKKSANGALDVGPIEAQADTNLISADPTVEASLQSIVNANGFANLTAETVAPTTIEGLSNSQAFDALNVNADASQSQNIDSFENISVFANLTSQNTGQVESISSLQNTSQFDDLQTQFIQAANIDSFQNSSQFGAVSGQISGQSIAVDSISNNQSFGDFEFVGSAAIESFINSQAFDDLTGALSTYADIDSVINVSQFDDFESYRTASVDSFQNDNGFGILSYWQEFRPQAHHVKRFGARMGDLDLSDRVTSVGGNKSESGVYLTLTIAGFDLIDEINARSNEQIEFYAVWQNMKTGEWRNQLHHRPTGQVYDANGGIG